ncbi:hypothetical protein B0H15DRAFT_568427 [Mycena belliarum]|uniref:Uncharacterized protein n=1 Tax=Mycena belliarum TaxID=1033014 RepID=A0AAD6TRM4_9AGAR|nr:hypothetical protein B0H15DRAFT_567912 [Mycena belliae]KAJ7077116.1 hypothetical protein B0H15DRAFT_568427 [Mycena belliae]
MVRFQPYPKYSLQPRPSAAAFETLHGSSILVIEQDRCLRLEGQGRAGQESHPGGLAANSLVELGSGSEPWRRSSVLGCIRAGQHPPSSSLNHPPPTSPLDYRHSVDLEQPSNSTPRRRLRPLPSPLLDIEHIVTEPLDVGTRTTSALALVRCWDYSGVFNI